MYIRLSLLAMVIFCITMSCKSPSKLLKDGKYDKAFEKSLADLKKDKNKRENRSTLLKAFNELVKQTESEAQDLLVNPDIKYAVEAYERYDDIMSQYDEGKQWLSGDYSSKMVDIESQQELVRENLVESFWTYSQEDITSFEDSGRKTFAQSAYTNLEGYQRYGGDDPSVPALKEAMYEAGIIRVNIVAEQRWGFSNNWEIDDAFDDIEREESQWLKIDYDGNRPDYDCLMQISLSEPAFNRQNDRFNESFSKEIQDGYTTEVDTAGNVVQVPKMRTVTATVTTNRTRVTGNYEAQVDWASRTGECNFRSERFNSREFIDCETYEISGDERAVPSRYQNQSSFSNNCDVEEDILEEMLEDLADEMRREYFR